jgi:hypothetical protein
MISASRTLVRSGRQPRRGAPPTSAASQPPPLPADGILNPSQSFNVHSSASPFHSCQCSHPPSPRRQRSINLIWPPGLDRACAYTDAARPSASHVQSKVINQASCINVRLLHDRVARGIKLCQMDGHKNVKTAAVMKKECQVLLANSVGEKARQQHSGLLCEPLGPRLLYFRI